MKRLFVFGLVVGFAGTLAGAYLFPWVSYTRYPSETSVVANGGRAEQFVIRLPADRIESHVAADLAGGTTLGAAAPEGAVPSSAGPAPAQVDHYKLRDRAGNVVGIAARHAVTEDRGATAWLLAVPSRGALMLAGTGQSAAAVEAMLVERGWTRGETWTGELVVREAGAAASVAATREFAGLEVELSELWTISGVEADGELRGTIELNTVGRRGT
jgi:hypothetical protein